MRIRHLAILRVNPEFMAGVCRDQGFPFRVKSDIPHGAKCIAHGYSIESDCFHFVYEHEDFPEHVEGNVIQKFLNVSFELIRPEPS